MSDFFIADDLSGALDAAAAFLPLGWPVRVVLAPEAWCAADEAIVGVTTETRNAAPAAAAATVARVLAHGRTQGARLIYKKIDSTLRGPVAAELGALAVAMPEARMLFAPANPAAGRTVRDGVLCVGGVPVTETEFARDPVCPVTESRIGRLLRDLDPRRLVIPDVANEGDLARAVEQMAAGGGPWVGVGSGGLIRPVAAARCGRPAGEPRPAEPARPAAGDAPVLFVCGSAHPANREQAEALAHECGLRPHTVDPGAPRGAVEGAMADLHGKRAAILRLPPRDPEAAADSRTALAALVEAVRATLAGSGVRRLFVTGGETAFALCAKMGLAALTVRAEVESGLVGASTAAPEGEPWRVVIKNGGFGSERAWPAAARWLRG